MMTIVREVETWAFGVRGRGMYKPRSIQSLWICYQIRKEKMSEEEKGLTAAEQVKKNISLLLNVSKLGQRHGGLRKRFISGRRGSSLGRPKVWGDDGGTERKDKESIHGRNNGSGITQGRTDEIISGDGNAENASPKKKKKRYFRNGDETKQHQ